MMENEMETKNPEANYNMKFLWMICIVAAMGGLLFGYDWIVIAGAKAFYEPFFNITDDTPLMRGCAQSSALFGCLFGAILSGMLTDKFGRKKLLITAGFVFTASAILTAAAWDFTSFLTARIIGGMGIGLASNLSPMYIAEISPAEMRGKFVSINQLTIVIGILLAQITNMCIANPVPTADQIRLVVSSEQAVVSVYGDKYNIEEERSAALAITDKQALESVKMEFPALVVTSPPKDDGEAIKEKERLDNRVMTKYILPTWNGQKGWRWMFGAEMIPALAFFVLMFFIPESPRWLVKYGKNEQAEKILSRIGGAEYGKVEVADIQQTLAGEEIAHVRFQDLLEPKLMKIIGLGIFLAVFQQWCGINVIFNYAQEVFRQAGYGVTAMLNFAVISAVVNLVATFIAIYSVDRFGRKVLMLIGAGGLTCFYTLLGTGYYLHSTGIHMVFLIVISIGCYAMTLAPVTWVLISELFPNRIRGAAMSIAVLSLWIACTVVTWMFPYLLKMLGAHGSFWTFGGICVVGFIVIFKKLPETKGKTLENIERELVD
jgi:MFS family permease